MTFGVLGPGSGFQPMGDLSPNIRRIGRPTVGPATQPGAQPGPVTPQQQILAALLGGKGVGGIGGIGGGRENGGDRGGFTRNEPPVGSERIDLGIPKTAMLGALLGGPIGFAGGLARDVFNAPRTRSLTDRQARDIQTRADREDREANDALREGRGSGAGPRRGAENAGNRGR